MATTTCIDMVHGGYSVHLDIHWNDYDTRTFIVDIYVDGYKMSSDDPYWNVYLLDELLDAYIDSFEHMRES